MTSLWPLIRGGVFVCWIVAAARLAIDARATPDISHPLSYVSVFLTTALFFIWAGFSRRLDGLSYKRCWGAFFLMGLLCFGLPNAVAYTTAQFQGWTHGRFRPPSAESVAKGEFDSSARTAPIAATTAGKIGSGLMIGGMTTFTGTLWCAGIGTLFAYLPGRYRRRKSAAA